MKYLPRVIQFLVGSSFMALLFFHSCANPGAGPNGGPRDSIPPMILKSIPEPNQINYNQKTISIDFDEFVVADKLSEMLVISPPLAKRPDIKSKGRSIQLVINEDLIPYKTYSFDFKTGIKDNNEGNPIEPFRMIFSTGDHLDTLRMSGHVLDAFTLNPVKQALVSIYELENDSVFRSLRPDYISRTNDEGYFMFDNLQSKPYRIYALVDGDNNLFYSQDSEAISFIDSLITPTAHFVSKVDTIIHEKDTLISKGYVDYSPDNIYHLVFTEKIFNQYLVTNRRSNRESLFMHFNEPLIDSFSYRPLNLNLPDSLNWKYEEMSANRDSVFIWVTDSIVAATDSMKFQVNYSVKTKLGADSLRTDTLQFVYVEQGGRGRGKKDETPKPIQQADLISNIKGKHNLNEAIVLSSSFPLNPPDTSMVHFREQINDSTFANVSWTYDFDSITHRKVNIHFKPKGDKQYILTADSAAFSTIIGTTTSKLNLKFATQTEDFYGTIIVNITGQGDQSIVQLLKNSDKEEVIKEVLLKKNQKEVVFDYLTPEKYIIKLIDDVNQNGKWDTGNLKEKLNPERVFYLNKALKVKSNWELKESLNIDRNQITIKEIIDEDAPKDQDNKKENTNNNYK